MLKLFSFAVLIAGISAAHSIVKKSVGMAGSRQAGPPYPLWHLEPLYVKALPAQVGEKRETGGETESEAEVEESHSVLTDIDGQRNGVQQKVQKGEQ